MKVPLFITLVAILHGVTPQSPGISGLVSQIEGIINKSNKSDVVSLADSMQFLVGFNNLMQDLQNVIQDITLPDNECFRQLQLVLDGITRGETWAIKMFDAMAKIQPGILNGNIMHLGNYDECLDINVFVNETQINGKYCTAPLSEFKENTMDLHNQDTLVNLKISYGFCIPAACDNASITEVVRVLETILQSPLHFQFLEDICDSSVKPKSLSVGAILSISLFSFIGIFIASSTIYDILLFRKKEDKEASLLTAFSVYTNGNKLFSTKTSGDSLNCLNGMRVISMIWIIAGHRYMYIYYIPLTNLDNVMKWHETTFGTLITSVNLAVDTFFLISGLLVVYVYLNNREKGRSISTVMLYVHRLLRLSPSLAMAVLFYATLLKYIGTGPLWNIVYYMFQYPCETVWWKTLLYVQNYVDAETMCMDHTWYLAVDTQLYFLSPLLLLPLIKWPKRTISVILILVFFCCAATFEITWLKQLRPAYYGLDVTLKKNLYYVTHVRAAPWLLGFIMGYVIFQCRKQKIMIHKAIVVFLWLVSTGSMLGLILYHKKIASTVDVDVLQSSLINSLGRTVWALALSVIIFLCVMDYGGLINKFLSAPIFSVLIRLNYNMYLLHIAVIVYYTAQLQTPEYVSPQKMFYLFWGDLIITLLLSIVWTLAFESPILVLEKILFSKKKRSATTEPQVFNNIIDIVIDNKLTNTSKSNID